MQTKAEKRIEFLLRKISKLDDEIAKISEQVKNGEVTEEDSKWILAEKNQKRYDSKEELIRLIGADLTDGVIDLYLSFDKQPNIEAKIHENQSIEQIGVVTINIKDEGPVIDYSFEEGYEKKGYQIRALNLIKNYMNSKGYDMFTMESYKEDNQKQGVIKAIGGVQQFEQVRPYLTYTIETTKITK